MCEALLLVGTLGLSTVLQSPALTCIEAILSTSAGYCSYTPLQSGVAL